jgi:hypothetical protein
MSEDESIQLDFTDPEDLRSPVLPAGEYPATLIYAEAVRKDYRDKNDVVLPDVQQINIGYVLGEHPDEPDAAGMMLFEWPMPILKGKSDKFLNHCRLHNVHPKEWTPSAVLESQVILTVAYFVRKSGDRQGEPGNAINKVRLDDSAVE